MSCKLICPDWFNQIGWYNCLDKAHGLRIFEIFFQIDHFSGIATEMSVWDGVVVSPQERAYVKPEKNKDGNGDTDMEIVKS